MTNFTNNQKGRKAEKLFNHLVTKENYLESEAIEYLRMQGYSNTISTLYYA